MKSVKTKSMRRIFSLILSIALLFSLGACTKNAVNNESDTPLTSSAESNLTYTPAIATDLTKLAFDNSAWNYDADNDVYWQIGVAYCATPETTEYESLGIYVPGAYMTGTANADGTVHNQQRWQGRFLQCGNIAHSNACQYSRLFGAKRTYLL